LNSILQFTNNSYIDIDNDNANGLQEKAATRATQLEEPRPDGGGDPDQQQLQQVVSTIGNPDVAFLSSRPPPTPTPTPTSPQLGTTTTTTTPTKKRRRFKQRLAGPRHLWGQINVQNMLEKMVWVQMGKTEHQAWLMEEIAGKTQVVVKWEITNLQETVPIHSISFHTATSEPGSDPYAGWSRRTRRQPKPLYRGHTR
jgi:hypothetical protein